jgi:regulator of sigma D|tara:strand:+ start:2902 stop:3111 length:210 start_codon:yes stop_codon:yes gene_type:complete
MGLYNFVNNILEKLIAPAQQPLILNEPITKTDLKHKTKKELEEIGRDLGMELDRRLTKDKLIKQIQKVL